MKNRFRAMSPGKKMLLVGSIALYAAIFAALIFLSARPQGRQGSSFGSMEGRFRSDITLEHRGDTYYYRENEITNYLIIGLDRQDIGNAVGHQSGGQADFLIVLSIDRVRRTVTPIMLDRDTMTEVKTYGIFGDPAGSRVMQLCLAQAYSGHDSTGSENTVQAVEQLLCGVKIDHHITLDISAIPLLNDALGGVEVTLKDDFSAFDPAMVPGATLRLQGKQAEFFVRGRMTVADGTNASRMERQQQYLSRFLTQLQEQSDADPETFPRLLEAVSGHIQSDASDDTLLHDAQTYDNYAWQPLEVFPGEHIIDRYGFAEFWPHEASVRSIAADIWFTKEVY